MRFFRRLFPSLLLFANIGAADTILLKNGDRVSGSIVKQDGKTITIKSDQFGTITANWDAVQSVVADKPVTVVLRDGHSSQRTLDASVPVAEITAIRNADEQRAYERLLNPGLTELWAGTASVGLAGTSGNAQTFTFTTGVNAARITRGDKTSIYFNAIKASALVGGRNSGTAQAIRGGFGYDRNLGPRMFVNLFNDYEYDRFQNLDLRFVLGGGVGVHVFKSERSFLDLLGGGAYNRSQFSTPLTRNSGESYFGDQFSFRVNKSTSLVQSFRMFNDLTNGGAYRINFDAGASTKIANWLTWNVSISDRYLSNPAPGRNPNDFLYTTGVGFTFAR